MFSQFTAHICGALTLLCVVLLHNVMVCIGGIGLCWNWLSSISSTSPTDCFGLPRAATMLVSLPLPYPPPHWCYCHCTCFSPPPLPPSPLVLLPTHLFLSLSLAPLPTGVIADAPSVVCLARVQRVLILLGTVTCDLRIPANVANESWRKRAYSAVNFVTWFFAKYLACSGEFGDVFIFTDLFVPC